MEHSLSATEATNRGNDSDRICQAITGAIADAEGVEPTELTPLYTAIEPDALEALFQPQHRGTAGPVGGEIRFSYHGYEVRVTADGEAEVTEDTDR